jgi:hypothetical protein
MTSWESEFSRTNIVAYFTDFAVDLKVTVHFRSGSSTYKKEFSSKNIISLPMDAPAKDGRVVL